MAYRWHTSGTSTNCDAMVVFQVVFKIFFQVVFGFPVFRVVVVVFVGFGFSAKTRSETKVQGVLLVMSRTSMRNH
jgi:hypothetical protein